ncbi:hypothetical protein [Actinotalea solisilvae]|uniref:hypothetical protein n=1 Tax=Actinotalea solisilvae TaxID=2072922 RepID=UPI0018F274A3|nr:hypothetical protein [Actinotalea solisilvae]
MAPTEVDAPRRPRTRRVLVWALGTVVVAVVVGVVVGAVVALVMTALVSDDATDGWAGLAAVVVGVVAAVLAAVLTWVIGLVVGARRYFPRGSRAVAVLLTLGTAALGSAALIVLLDATGVGGGAVTGSENKLLVIIAMVALSAAVFPWWERRLSRRR